MQRLFTKTIFIAIILFFALNAFPQTNGSRFSIEDSIKNLKTKSGKIIDENGMINLEVDENGQVILENGVIFYCENLSKIRAKLTNLYDDEKHDKLNAYVETVIENENINVDKIDWSNEILAKCRACIMADSFLSIPIGKRHPMYCMIS